MDIHVCRCRSGHVCYHGREQHLRRDDNNRRQGTAVIEGTARYGHQGGGKRQKGQIEVPWKKIMQEK
jgi:hypothetical protein